jgi:hypothetical protein
MNARVLLKGLGLILSLALFAYLFNASDLGNSVNEAWIDARIRDHGVEGELLFLMMGAFSPAMLLTSSSELCSARWPPCSAA